MKVGRMSALHTGRLYPPKYPWNAFLLQAELTSRHSAAGMINSMKTAKDPTGNQTRNLPVYSAVSQPTSPPRLQLGEGGGEKKEKSYLCDFRNHTHLNAFHNTVSQMSTRTK
jgi:hypothetical protein